MEKVSFEELRLLDLDGRPVDLTACFQNYLLLIFLRHLAWLPCQAHLGEVRSFKTEFDRRGAAIAVVSFADPAKLRDYQQSQQWPFVMLADPARAAYRAFALERLSWLRVFSPRTIKLYFKLLRAGMTRHDYGKDDIYQSGGDFLLDRSGNILFAHRSRDPADRPPVAEVLQAIDRK